MNVPIMFYLTCFLMLCGYSEGDVMDDESDFLKVSKRSAFVDKSILIKPVFESSNKLLITAPRKFGKSTNLNMMKHFFTLASENETEIKETFQKLNIYENNSTFYRNNFGKHPVLYVDFRCEKTDCYEDALDCYRSAIHNAFLDHDYLKDSNNLKENDKLLCDEWCSQRNHTRIEKKQIKVGLTKLTEMLNDHFGKEVVVLIDEYDSVNNKALLQVKSNEQFEDILSLTTAILTGILQSNRNVLKAVVTGLSYISTTGLLGITNLKRCRFLDHHQFVDFYGLTEDEVGTLFKKDAFKSQANKAEVAKKYYNGFVSKQGRRIYNTYSLINFLTTNESSSYWNTSDFVSSIPHMLNSPGMVGVIALLLDGKSINITVYDKIRLSDVLKLKNVYLKTSSKEIPSPHLLLAHLLELGLVTYNKTFMDSDLDYIDHWTNIPVTIPNQEAHNIIHRDFKQHLIDKLHT